MDGETENQTGKVKNEEDTEQPNPHESWKKYCRLTHTYGIHIPTVLVYGVSLFLSFSHLCRNIDDLMDALLPCTTCARHPQVGPPKPKVKARCRGGAAEGDTKLQGGGTAEGEEAIARQMTGEVIENADSYYSVGVLRRKSSVTLSMLRAREPSSPTCCGGDL